MSRIEILRFKPFVKASLRGFFDIGVPKMGIELYGCSLHGKGDQRWINLPSKEYEGADGQVKYAPIMRFSKDEHYTIFRQAVHDAIIEHCKANKIDIDPPQSQAVVQGISQQDDINEEFPF